MTTFGTQLSVNSPADILSYIPHALGFHPVESLVVLTLHGKKLGATLRVDLPAPGCDPADFARGACSFLAADSAADGSLLVLYTSAPWLQPDGPPHHLLVEQLRDNLRSISMALRDGWLVSGTFWREYFCDDADCCPWPGHPLHEISDSTLNAAMIFTGSTVAGSVNAAVHASVAPSLLDRHEVDSAAGRYQVLCEGRWRDRNQFAAVARTWDAVLTEGRTAIAALDADTAGYLLASLRSRTIRDSVLVIAARGYAEAWSGTEACGVLQDNSDPFRATVWPGSRIVNARSDGTGTVDSDPLLPPSEDPAARYGDLLSGRFGGQLNWERIDVAAELLGSLSGLASGEVRAAVCSMLGWIEFARGRGSRAGVHLQEALASAPGYRLALLMEELISRGGMPVWALRRETAWRERRPARA